jgi:hypothetical protein
MNRSRRLVINLISGASLALVLSLAADAAEPHPRADSGNAVVTRPSADLLATLTGPSAPSPSFTRLAASTSTVVAQGAETDVFTKSPGGWQSAGRVATLVDPDAPVGGTGLSISADTVVEGFGSPDARSVEDVFVKPTAGWSGAVSPAARLIASGSGQTLVNGVIAGRVIAAKTTSAQEPLGPVDVFVKPTAAGRGRSAHVRVCARPRTRSPGSGWRSHHT